MSDLHSALLAAGDKQALVAALANAAGMPVPAANLPAVAIHLGIAASMAQILFAAAPSPDAALLAPVFRLPAGELPDAATR